MIGGFPVVAGRQHDPGETAGLSGALSDLGDTLWSTPLLWGVGVGLIGYAVFAVLEAKYRRTA